MISKDYGHQSGIFDSHRPLHFQASLANNSQDCVASDRGSPLAADGQNKLTFAAATELRSGGGAFARGLRE
jgi:hypothetical protein